MLNLFKTFLLIIQLIISLLYLTIITLIIPRISSAEAKRRVFPKQPIVYYLSFYLLSTFFLSVISSLPSSLTIIINLLLLAISRSIGLKLRLIGLTGQTCAGKSLVIQYLIHNYNAVVISNESILQFIRDNNKQLLCSIEKEFNVSFDGENVSTGDIIEFDVHRFQLILINDERITYKVEKTIKWKVYWYLFKRIIYEKLINNKQHVILDFDMLLKFDSINVICFPIVSICNTEKDLVLTRIRNKYNYDYQSSFEVYSNQITVEEYNLKSEKVIHNEGTIDELYRKIDRFMHNMFV